MNAIPGRRRFRPILRMNDLLHPIQQRERMEAFSSADEKNTYLSYSRIWAGGQPSALLTVKTPKNARRVDEETYLVLLQQRVSWMMQCWLRDWQSSPVDLEHQLNDTIAQVCPGLSPESALLAGEDEDFSSLKQWCSEWAETLVQECDRIPDILHLEDIRFPILTIDHSHPNFQELCDLHDEIDIETWLALLLTSGR